MKQTIKTKNGTVVADFPDDFQHDYDALHDAADYLDSEGMYYNSETAMMKFNGEDGETIGTMTWTYNQEEQ